MNLRYKIVILMLLLSFISYERTSGKMYKFREEKFGNPLSKLLSRVVIEFYSIKSIQVDIMRAAEDRQSELIQSGIINEVLYDIEAKIPVRLDDHETARGSYPRVYNILVVDSYKSFRKILYTEKANIFDFTGFYMIVLTSIEQNYTDSVQKILQDCWELYIVNVNVVTYDPADNTKAFMYTYFPYTPKHCAKVKPIISGVFWNETFTRDKQIFPDKVSNFYGCNLTVGTFNFPPYMILKQQESGSYTFDGFEGILARVLGQRLHFSLIPKLCHDRWGKIEGDNSTGLSGMVLRGEVNFSLGAFAASFSHYGLMDSSIPYHPTALTLLVPPGKPHTPMAKLFLPIRYIIWSCLAACFIISGIVVTVAKFLAPQRRAFIFGPRTHHPFINTINAFLGGSNSSVPRRNFARFILILWILMSLVVRSSYQGALFTILKDKKNVSVVDTFARMLQEDFKIYGVEGTKKYFDSMTKYKGMFITGTPEEVDEYRLNTADYTFKAAVVTPATIAAYMNEKHAADGASFRISKENIITLYICIYMRKYSYLKVPFNREIMMFMESGLLQRWTSIFYNPKYLKERPQQNRPKPLTFYELSGIFTVFVLLLGLSILVFILELLSQRFSIVRGLCDFLN